MNERMQSEAVRYGGNAGAANLGDDYLTIVMMASGLSQILARRRRAAEGESAKDGRLPAPWLMAFSRLWWRFAEQGCAPLESDLELLALCSRPLGEWPIRLSLAAMDLEHSLLVGNELSDFADQASRLAKHDVEGEYVENQIHHALRAAAEANGKHSEAIESAYAKLRRFLIDRTVLSESELRSLELHFPSLEENGQPHVRRLINYAYTSRRLDTDETIICCSPCGNVIVSAADKCGTPGCSPSTPRFLRIAARTTIYEQNRAARRFIHDPGLVEARIVDALSAKSFAKSIIVVPYPGVDVLDVAIQFVRFDPQTGPTVLETWGCDAKDQISARLLGRTFSWPQTIDCQRRFLVLPKHRAKQRNYIMDLTAELRGRVQVEVIAEHKLPTLVKDRAMGLGL